MKVKLEQVTDASKEGALIRTVAVTDEIKSAIELLENARGNLILAKDGENYPCPMSSIYYIESVDKKTFVYTKDDCYESKYRLYELEEMLSKNFLRCSKNTIINIRKIRSVKSDYNGRMNAVMLSGDTLVISRSYVKELKKILGLG